MFSSIINTVIADVVKPALIEIKILSDGKVNIEIRTSIEALLTGINGRYRNTQDAPEADHYDELRVLSAADLAERFKPFQNEFIESIILQHNEKALPISITDVVIPPAGYTKVPRNSVVNLEGQLEEIPDTIRWYYPIRFSDQAVRVKLVNPAKNEWYWSDYQWIREDRFSDPFSLDQLDKEGDIQHIVRTYLVAGFRHILPLGLDHILFIVGLLLLLQGIKPLVWQVTMFTIAHTITLGVATYGLLTLPAIWVEPLIALSIAYIGVENLINSPLPFRRLIVVFMFGLLHGFGFAAMLSEFGLPSSNFFLALLTFNLGVEIGQLSVLAIVWILIFSWLKDVKLRRQFVVIPGSILISLIGLFWCFERLEWFGSI